MVGLVVYCGSQDDVDALHFWVPQNSEEYFAMEHLKTKNWMFSRWMVFEHWILVAAVLLVSQRGPEELHALTAPPTFDQEQHQHMLETW